MSLEKYHKKREFTKTPEPKGKSISGKGPLTFVVQKHHATQLHYDLRLELNGVMKSWAVPKGPSLNPEDKRLAMMVEDHPMDYSDFEGIIPKGNYGGGTVMVWDNGVYAPLDSVERDEAEKILNAQLEKGHLTFVLMGKKLKGEFALVRLRKAAENAWLLIKKNDEYASKKDILDEDKSVLTKRSLEQIGDQASKKKEVWVSKPKNLNLDRAVKGAMPHMVKPMLAHTIELPFDDKDWIYEMKFDGYRAIAEIEAGKVKLYSRNKQTFNTKFSQVVEALSKFPGKAVLDGEVVVLDKNGHPDFQSLQNYTKASGELVYYVFDILYFDGHNLEDLPLLKRKEILKQVLPSIPHLAYSDHIEENGVEFFKQATKLKLEGIMAKKADGPYREGVRSADWLKIKTAMRQEAIIAGFTEPKGGRKNFGALVLGVYRNGKLKYIGHTGGGFNDKNLESIHKKLITLRQEKCPFEKVPETNAPVTWVKPKLICEVTFAEWTKDRIMRQPIFLGLREDKDTKKVVEEKFFSKEAPGKEGEEIKIGKQKVKITHLNKVFWPKEKYTKGDLINYYREIAPIILPHLKDRPQSLLRYPDGIEGQKFFQKDVGNLTADWLQTHKIHSDSGDKKVEYLICNDEATLIYMINLGCIDLNPWNSRLNHLDNPDFLIIDLDPEGVKFEKVVKVAQAVKDVLDELEITGYPKTSGATGMHVYIPLGAKYTYEQARHFTELICIQVQNKVPDITSMVRSPKKRENKVYLDYLQNAKGQTLASVYSVRAKPGATVATPLKWSEVTEELHPSLFTIQNIPDRLNKIGDLFKPVLEKGIDMAKVLKKLENLSN